MENKKNDELRVVRIYDWTPPIVNDALPVEEEPSLPVEIRQKYDFVNRFFDGYAVAGKIEDVKYVYLILDIEGNEYRFTSADGSECKEYEKYGYCSDGMFSVSIIQPPRLSAFHDYENWTGLWGYTNTAGREVIAPQYIFALPFENGRALVCKGEWYIDGKSSINPNADCYWSEKMLWGVIDKKGDEIIPCIFDELEQLQRTDSFDNSNLYKAHYGGWKNGKYGILDAKGDWVVEPMFVDVNYEVTDDGLFAFSTFFGGFDFSYGPVGVYSIPEKRVILEPDSSYLYIEFLENGYLDVETRDENDRGYSKIIDLDGNPIIDNSDYRVVHDLGDLYYCIQWDTDKFGVLDQRGNEVLPIMYTDIKFRDGYLFAYLDDEKEVYQVRRK